MEEIEKRYECPLLIGDAAPAWSAVTTLGKISLSDFIGKWVLMFSHPADFTPVCTSEFVAFAKVIDEFIERNVQLIGLSIDSVHSHIAWVRNLEEKFDVSIDFPIIADLDMHIAKMYGMIHAATSTVSTVRSVFLLDDKHIIRAMLHYPMTNGRNIEEILRLIDALQTSDKHHVATPANWHKGDKCIVPPPTTVEGAKERLKEDYECVDWYYCKRPIQ